MRKINLIRHRITDLEHDIQLDNSLKQIQSSRINILYWAIQNNEVKTEKQIKVKINRIKEEMLCANKDNMFGDTTEYYSKQASIEELEDILKD